MDKKKIKTSAVRPTTALYTENGKAILTENNKYLLGSPQIGAVAPSQTAPTTIAISNINLTTVSPIGDTIATITSDELSTTTLTNDGGGYVTLAAGTLRLEKDPGAANNSFTITVKATNAYGSITQNFTLTTAQFDPRAGAVMNFRANAGVSTTAGVMSWVDQINSANVLTAPTATAPANTTNATTGTLQMDFTGSKYMTMNSAGIAHLQSLMWQGNYSQWSMIIISQPNSFSATKSLFTVNSNLPSANNEVMWMNFASSTGAFSMNLGSNTKTSQGIPTTTAGPSATRTTPSAGTVRFNMLRHDGWGMDIDENGISYFTGAASVTPNPLGAATVSAVYVGKNGTTSNYYFNDPIFEILIYDHIVDHVAVYNALAPQYGLTATTLPAELDLSQYTLVYNNDFDISQPLYNLDATQDFIQNELPLPCYFNSGLYGGYLGPVWLVDPRTPQTAAYNPFSRADNTTLRITAQPTPSEFNYAGGAAYIAGAMTSVGLTAANVEYGYWEARIRQPIGQSGMLDAWWLMPTNNTWQEFDIYEHHASCLVVPTGGFERNARFYTGQQMTSPGQTVSRDLGRTFNLFGLKKGPDGVFLYLNRRLMAQYTWNGVMGVPTITNGGSGYTSATKVTATCTYLNPLDEYLAYAPTFGTPVISGGVIQSIPVVKPGSGLASVTLNITDTGGGTGATATIQVATADPPCPPAVVCPHYWLLDFNIGSYTGTPDNTRAPWFWDIDYIRVYQQNFTANAIPSGTDSDAAAYFTACSNAGVPASTNLQNKVNAFIKGLKSVEFRFDTVPMQGQTSDWDVTQLSLWQALATFCMFSGVDNETQALIDLRNPSNIFTKTGVPSGVWSNSLGYTFNGTNGQYINTNINTASHNLIRPNDAMLGCWLTAAPTNTTLAPIMGANASTYFLYGSNTTSHVRVNSSQDMTPMLGATPGTGYLNGITGVSNVSALVTATNYNPPALGANQILANRGWQGTGQMSINGQEAITGYLYGDPVVTPSGILNVGGLAGAGVNANCSIGFAYAGRRLVMAEQQAFYNLLQILKTS
jgi:hypothetical protein